MFLPLAEQLDRWESAPDDVYRHSGFARPQDFWAQHVAGRGEMDRDQFVQFAQARARRFQPVHAIQQRVDETMAGEDADWVGVHIRRTDLEYEGRHGIRNDFRVANDDCYVRAMERELAHNDRTLFYLATDNPKTQAEFMERFGDRIRVAVTQFAPPEAPAGLRADQCRLTSMDDAVVDLCCLSRCDRILGTSGSTFSVVAGWMGGRPVTLV